MVLHNKHMLDNSNPVFSSAALPEVAAIIEEAAAAAAAALVVPAVVALPWAGPPLLAGTHWKYSLQSQSKDVV